MHSDPHAPTPLAEPADDTLMVRVAKGEQAALVMLMRRHQAQVVRVAARLTGDANAAQDIAQEVFLRVWKKADRYTGQGQFTAYLLRVTRNLCEDTRRKTAKTETNEHDLARICAASAHTQAEHNALQQAVAQAVSSLPEVQRDVFVLSHFEGLSYAEIADITDCPMGTVASRKHQAVQNLRRALRDWFPSKPGEKEPIV